MWPFRPRPPLIHLLPDESWRAGDMAECVCGRWICPVPIQPRPQVGARAMVLSVHSGKAETGPFVIVGLQLLGFSEMWDARGFRKIVLADTGADRMVNSREPVDA